MADFLLDLFTTNQSAFQLAELSAALIKQPLQPQALGRMGLFVDRGLETRRPLIEELHRRAGLLGYVQPRSPGTVIKPSDRVARPFLVPCIKAQTAVYADEISGVRAFGAPQALETIQGKIIERSDDVRTGFVEPTLELLRVGALLGYQFDPEVSTTYFVGGAKANWCTELGVARPSSLKFNLSSAGEMPQVKTQFDSLRDSIIGGLQGAPCTGFSIMAGREWYRAFKNFVDFVTFIQYADMGAGAAARTMQNLGPNSLEQYQNGTPHIQFQGFDIWEYTLSLGFGVASPQTAVDFVDPAKAYAYPTGVPGHLFQFHSPADYYLETVNNGPGLPVYVHSQIMPQSRGVDIEVSSNPLCVNFRPGSTVELTYGSK